VAILPKTHKDQKMKANKICLIIISIYLLCSCQNNEKKHLINITDFIHNTPNNKSFENKFIVIEFWATWCGPCLDAVPHLNELQEKFKSNNDLVFISMTDEKPEKIQATLDRIDFNTIVVSDQSKKTHKDLEVEKNGVMMIPLTILIDNNGNVKWRGYPEELNEEKINSFLKGEQIKETKKAEESVVELSEKDFLDKITLKMKNKSIDTLFLLEPSNNNNSSLVVNGILKGKFIAQNKSVSEIFSNLLEIPEEQINISSKFRDLKFNLAYKNTTDKDLKLLLKDKLLKRLNLNESIDFKEVEIYELKILEKSKIKNSKKTSDNMGHISESKTHLILSNSNIEGLSNEISDLFKIVVKNKTGLNGNYDLILNKGSFLKLNKDLITNGLMLEKRKQKTEIYNYK
jgi:uncharacterized protein (TIGR03435 family)